MTQVGNESQICLKQIDLVNREIDWCWRNEENPWILELNARAHI